MIETDVNIVKVIGLKITEEDVDGFLKDLDLLFDRKLGHLGQVETDDIPGLWSTLYKIWLEIKQNE